MSIARRLLARQTKPEEPSQYRVAYVPSKQAGALVSHDTALMYSAIWGCVRILSNAIMTLPWRVFMDKPGGGKEKLPNHPVDWCLQYQANPEMTALKFRETMLGWALTWGNAYAEIERDTGGRLWALWPIPPDRVDPKRLPNGELIYEISNLRGPPSYLYPSEIFHLSGLGWDGVVGYSIVSMCRQAIGMGLALEDFGSSFFENGTVIGGVLEHPKSLSPDAQKRLKEAFDDRHKGPGNANKTLVLEEGMKYAKTATTPEDSQYNETRKVQVAEIARFYGVPLHKLAELDKATFSNIEEQNIDFVQDGVMPWIKRLETEADAKLFGRQQRGRVFTKLNLNGLLRGDSAKRGTFYQTLWNIGVLSVNDIRELEDMDPIKYGEEHFVELNRTTLEKATQEPAETSGDKADSSDNPSDAGGNGTDSQQAPVKKALLVSAFQKCLKREAGRAADNIKRCAGDRDKFIHWMDKFFAQHDDYMRKEITPHAQVFAFYTPNDNDASDAVERLINSHIQDARLEMLSIFDGNHKRYTVDAEQMANRLIKDIVGV